METTIPREIITLIVEYSRSPLLREVSRAFCAIANAAILDNVSTHLLLAIKGDLYSLMIRFGHQMSSATTEELECITYYLTHRSRSHISKDVIKSCCFNVCIRLSADAAIVSRVLAIMHDNNITIAFGRFDNKSICHTVRHVDVSLNQTWIFHELDRVITNGKFADEVDVFALHGEVFGLLLSNDITDLTPAIQNIISKLENIHKPEWRIMDI